MILIAPSLDYIARLAEAALHEIPDELRQHTRDLVLKIEDLPDDPLERAEDVSIAFLLALERLSPLERAVFLLRDVFDADFAEVAKTLDRSEAAVRQLAVRAREHVKDARPRFSVSDDVASRLAAAFMSAAASQDWGALAELLTEDAVMITDGGGKRKAALRPMIGRDDVLLLLKGLASRGAWAKPPKDIQPARINGYPGVIMVDDEGAGAWAFQPSEDGRIAAIYGIRNPDKLRHLA